MSCQHTTFYHSPLPLYQLIALCSVFLVPSSVIHPQVIEIHQLDVGQGDAALIIIRQPVGREFDSRPSAFSLLIDSGPKGKGKKVIVPYLHKLGIDTLNAVLLTHYHADHIGGVSEVLSSEVVLKCYDRGGSYDSKAFDNYVSVAGPRRSTLKVGDTLFCTTIPCTSIPYTSIPPSPTPSIQCSIICVASGGNILNYGYTGTPDENTNSIGILLTYIVNTDTFKFLTAGDLTGTQESLLARYNPSIHNVSVMKVSHHGSQTATNPDALKSFAPKAVFISCGDNNQYGHPHAETLKTLDEQKSIEHIYQTEQGQNVGEKSTVSGNIAVKVYPNGRYTITTDRGSDPYHLGRKMSGHLLPLQQDKMLENEQSGWKTRYHDNIISLNISPPVYVQTISVLNILGTTLRRFSPMDYLGSVSISDNFHSGTYFVMIKTDTRATISKVIVEQ